VTGYIAQDAAARWSASLNVATVYCNGTLPQVPTIGTVSASRTTSSSLGLRATAALVIVAGFTSGISGNTGHAIARPLLAQAGASAPFGDKADPPHRLYPEGSDPLPKISYVATGSVTGNWPLPSGHYCSSAGGAISPL
jgi:hypothetical protein